MLGAQPQAFVPRRQTGGGQLVEADLDPLGAEGVAPMGGALLRVVFRACRHIPYFVRMCEELEQSEDPETVRRGRYGRAST